MENIQLIKLIRNCLAGDLVFLNFNITIFIQTAINPEADFFSGGREGRGKRGGGETQGTRACPPISS